jgi:rhodanese-related sulfurtransferase
MDHFSVYTAAHPWLLLFTAVVASAVVFFESRWRVQSRASVVPQQAIRLVNDGATLVDLRDAGSFGEGHIAGAKNVPGDKIIAGADALKKLKDRQIIVYCDKGAAGTAAVRTLTAQGFTNVLSLRGGVAAWRAEHLPLTRD